jgi:hypothetical protein
VRARVTKWVRVSAANVDERVGDEVRKNVDDEVGLDIIVIVPTSTPHTLTPIPPSRESKHSRISSFWVSLIDEEQKD